MTDYVENIILTYLAASDNEVKAGMEWYSDAHNLALELSPDNVWRGAGVIAALSPLKSWELNVRYARNAFATGIVAGNMPMHNAIGQRILNGEHPLDVMRGDKTRNFTMAIATNGMSDVATIDRHAHDIAMGRVYTDHTRKIGKRVYRTLADAYSESAELSGITVNQMQAVTWVAWKNRKAVA